MGLMVQSEADSNNEAWNCWRNIRGPCLLGPTHLPFSLGQTSHGCPSHVRVKPQHDIPRPTYVAPLFHTIK
uniref:Uncharacterized protein n=1 Tax=Cucumis melo TaxID=3656 RepID=A0A9I9DLT1_CUCME